jgi:hypothetical protein
VQVELVNPALRKEKLRLLYRQGYYARGAGVPSASPPASGDKSQGQ